MRIVLESLGGAFESVIHVSGPRFLIGRAEECDLRLLNPLISRHHAEVLIQDDTVLIRDLGSRNGTFLNGEQVVAEQKLDDGDVLSVAFLPFRVTFSNRFGRRLRSYLLQRNRKCGVS